MKTLYDFGLEVAKIREAANSLEVKGAENASLIVYIIEKCNGLIAAINEYAKPQKESDNDQNGSEEGEIDVSD